jgi:hypothetical protein
MLLRNISVTSISYNEKHPENLAAYSYHMKKERNNGRNASSEMMIPSADGELDSRGLREVGRRSSFNGLGNRTIASKREL